MRWCQFERLEPELARLGEERFDRTGLALVGTIRADGWPRISPVEPLITDGELYLGMTWRSRKALDLLRDSKCAVNSTVSDRHGTEGEGELKVYGRAVDVTDPERRSRYEAALREKIGWSPAPGDEYHLFSVDIESASFAVIRDGQWERRLWKAD